MYISFSSSSGACFFFFFLYYYFCFAVVDSDGDGCGGGADNGVLFFYLQQIIPSPLQLTNDIDVLIKTKSQQKQQPL